LACRWWFSSRCPCGLRVKAMLAGGLRPRLPTVLLLLCPVLAATSCGGVAGSGAHRSAGPSVGSPGSTSSTGSDAVVDGVTLATPWAAVSDDCRRAVTRTGLRIPCPTLAPTAKKPTAAWTMCRGYDGSLEGRGCPRDEFVLEEHFTGPPGYRGIPGPDGKPLKFGHLDVWAQSGSIPVRQNHLSGCPRPHTLGATRIDGTQAHWYSCQGSMEALDAGHLLLTWVNGDETYGVAVHGHTSTNRKLVARVALALTFFEPT
jgi:hypothetical protein